MIDEASDNKFIFSDFPSEKSKLINLQSSVCTTASLDESESTFYDTGENLITVSNYTCESNKNFYGGIICMILYIGIWMGSAVSIFLTMFLLLKCYYVSGSIMSVLIILCYVLPIQPSPSVRSLIRKYIGCYFKSASVSFESIPNKNDPTILCIMPHGCFSIAWAFLYVTEEIQHLRWCFSTLLRLSPFLRVITQLTGNPSSIRKSVIIDHLKNKRSIAIIPGGWHEATIHHDRIDRIYIRNRKGFIKYALQYGFSITPAFAFGEKGTYSNVQGFYSIRFWLNKHSIISMLPWGHKFFPIFPKRASIHVVVGSPIYFDQIPNPTKSDVESAHEIYIKEIRRIYEKYKYKFYNSEESILEIW